MSYKTRSQAKTDLLNIATLHISDGKIDSTELSQVIGDGIDSTTRDEPVTNLTSGTTIPWDFSASRDVNLSLANNGTLSITGLPTDGRVVFGSLQVTNTGSFTLSMPAGSKTNGGTVALGSGAITLITLRWDGAALLLGISQFS